MQLRAKMLWSTCLVALAGSAGYGLHAYAEGAPTTKPIFYAGTLEEGGKLAAGPHTISLTLWDAETAGKQLCTSETADAAVDNGRFRVEVSPDCVAAMKAQPDVWAGLKFTGGDGVPHELPKRSKVGAVPYALEAQHAVSASSAALAASASSAVGDLKSALDQLAARKARVVRVTDDRNGCPGAAGAHADLLSANFTLAKEASVEVSSDMVRRYTGRADISLLIDGTLAHIGIAQGQDWVPAHLSWAGVLAAGPHNVTVRGGGTAEETSIANVWGCGPSYGHLTAVIHD